MKLRIYFLCLLLWTFAGIGFLCVWLYYPHVFQTSTAEHIKKWVVINSKKHRFYGNFVRTHQFSSHLASPELHSFILYNISNIEDVLTGKASIKLEKKGPYVYERSATKKKIRFFANGSVTYMVDDQFKFIVERSKGSENDVIITVNAHYLDILTKLKNRRMTERTLLCWLAYDFLSKKKKHLQTISLMQIKKHALKAFIPLTFSKLQDSNLPTLLANNSKKIRSLTLPQNLYTFNQLLRLQAIPVLINDRYKSINRRIIPNVVKYFNHVVRERDVPRILRGTMKRLKVESLPFFLQRLLSRQTSQYFPTLLQDSMPRLLRISIPYTLSDWFNQSRVEVLPSILMTIKLELMQQLMDKSVPPDKAQRDIIDHWRGGTIKKDLDKILGGTPTGTARYGFELNPNNISGIRISLEVATLLFSGASNVDFSILQYSNPSQQQGFSLWKKVMLNDSTAVQGILNGINAEVAEVKDYITTAQILYISDYLKHWSNSDIVFRDRIQYWLESFNKRTQYSNTEAVVDVDLDESGTQDGFRLGNQSIQKMSIDSGLQLWNATFSYSLLTPSGIISWLKVTEGLSNETFSILNSTIGLNATQVGWIGSWLKMLLTNRALKNKLFNHWALGEDSQTQFDLIHDSRKYRNYDLEPGKPGIQTGFELPYNISSNRTFYIPRTLNQYLWNQTNKYSFLNTGFNEGYQSWKKLSKKYDISKEIVSGIYNETSHNLSVSQVQLISKWLDNWSNSIILREAIINWWRLCTCKKEVTYMNTTSNTHVEYNQQNCSPSVISKIVSNRKTTGKISPFLTQNITYSISSTVCSKNSTDNLFASTTVNYTLGIIKYSCDSRNISTISNDYQTGFELNSSNSIPPSMVVASYLWNATNTYSFVNTQGYRLWSKYREANSTNSSLEMLLLSKINSNLNNACTSLNSGDNSAFSNITLFNNSCDPITTEQIKLVSNWIYSQVNRKWLEDSLIEQWQNGGKVDSFYSESSYLDMEPYRHGRQLGWEVSLFAGSKNRTLPIVSKELWNKSSNISFLNSGGYALWIAANNLPSSLSPTIRKTNSRDARYLIRSHFNLSEWHNWMDEVAGWLHSWSNLDYTKRDILSHWLYGQCLNSSSIKNNKVINSTTVSNIQKNVSSCQPRYHEILDPTAYKFTDIESNQYFKSDYGDSIAKHNTTKIIWLYKINITCIQRTNGALDYEQKNITDIVFYEVLACNIHDLSLSKKGPQHGLSLNIPIHNISPDEASYLWNSSNKYSFLNKKYFKYFWTAIGIYISLLLKYLYVHKGDKELLTLINQENGFKMKTMDLILIKNWLFSWATNSLLTKQTLKYWRYGNETSQGFKAIDLNDDKNGIQSGFELLDPSKRSPSTNSFLPNDTQTVYLWSSENNFSFLNIEGYKYWQCVFIYHLNWKSHNRSNLALLFLSKFSEPISAYSLCIDAIRMKLNLNQKQIITIANWLYSWLDNEFVVKYVNHHWSLGENNSKFQNSAAFLNTHYVNKDLFYLFNKMRKSNATSLSEQLVDYLWNVSSPFSFLNPKAMTIWCLVKLSNASENCPHLFNVSNSIPIKYLNDAVLHINQTWTNVSATTIQNSSLQLMANLINISQEQVQYIADWVFSTRTNTFFSNLLKIEWTTHSSISIASHFDTKLFFIGFSRNRNLIIPFETKSYLWNASNRFSFLNEHGHQSIQTSVANNTMNLTFVQQSDIPHMNLTTWSQNASQAILLAKAITNWLNMWKNSIALQQYVQYLWHSKTGCVRKNGQTSYLCLSGYEFNAPKALYNSISLSTWTDLSNVLWNKTSSISFLNPKGINLWLQAVDTCSSTIIQSGKCTVLGSSNTQVYKVRGDIANEILRHFREMDAPMINRKIILELIKEISKNYLKEWLDKLMLEKYILSEINRQQLTTLNVTRLTDIPYVQILNGNISKLNFSSRVFENKEKVSLYHYKGFYDTVRKNSSNINKFWYDRFNQSVMVDVEAITHHLTLSVLRRYFDFFSDEKISSRLNSRLSNGISLMELFLSQPYSSKSYCNHSEKKFVSKNGKKIEPFFQCTFINSTIISSYRNIRSGYFLFPIPLLKAGVSNLFFLKFVSSMQMYLQYIGTKLVFEPRILKYQFTTSSHSQNSYINVSNDVPTIGGYFRKFTPTNFLFRTNSTPMDPLVDFVFHSDSGFFNKNISTAFSNTYWPYFSEGSSNRSLLFHIGTPNISKLGQFVGLDMGDGSQFVPTFAVANTSHLFDKHQIPVYWSDMQQPITLSKQKLNLSRFGVEVDRYMALEHISQKQIVLPYQDSFCLFPVQINQSKNSTISDGVISFVSMKENTANVVDVEPRSGITFHQRFNWQLQVELPPGNIWFQNVRLNSTNNNNLIPLFQVQQRSSILANQSQLFQQELYTIAYWNAKLPWISIGAAAFLECLGLYYLLRKICFMKRKLKKIQNFDSNTPVTKIMPPQ